MNDFSLRKLLFLPTSCPEIARFLPCQGLLPWKCSGEQVHPAGVQPGVKTGVLEVCGSLLLGLPLTSKIIRVPDHVTVICLLVPSAPIPWT